MGQLDKLETTLDDALRKKSPVQLPPEARAWIARNLWWLTLITGVCVLWSALTLWQAGHAIDRYAQAMYYWTGSPYIHHLGMPYYLSLLAIGAIGVVILLATPNLKDMRRSGWRYLFYAALLQVVAAACLLFSSYGGGFSHFLGSLIGAAVGAYFLFQVREHFTEKGAAATIAHHEAPATTLDETKKTEATTPDEVEKEATKDEGPKAHKTHKKEK